LAKLDYNRDRDLGILPLARDTGASACTIIAPGGSGFYVKAVEDEAHYADRAPGEMLVKGELV